MQKRNKCCGDGNREKEAPWLRSCSSSDSIPVPPEQIQSPSPIFDLPLLRAKGRLNEGRRFFQFASGSHWNQPRQCYWSLNLILSQDDVINDQGSQNIV